MHTIQHQSQKLHSVLLVIMALLFSSALIFGATMLVSPRALHADTGDGQSPDPSPSGPSGCGNGTNISADPTGPPLIPGAALGPSCAPIEVCSGIEGACATVFPSVMTVSAEGDQSVTGTSVELFGTYGAIAPAWIQSWGWTKVDGPDGGVFSGAYMHPTGTYSGESGTVVSGLTPGVYTFRLGIKAFDSIWYCPNPGIDDVVITVVAPPMNGACGNPSIHYACLVGTAANNKETASGFTWDCSGVLGGNPISCTEAKKPSINLDLFAPSSINVGETARMKFDATNATTCSANSVGTISGWNTADIGTVNNRPVGTFTPTMMQVGYVDQFITCTGPGGSTTAGPIRLTITDSANIGYCDAQQLFSPNGLTGFSPLPPTGKLQIGESVKLRTTLPKWTSTCVGHNGAYCTLGSQDIFGKYLATCDVGTADPMILIQVKPTQYNAQLPATLFIAQYALTNGTKENTNCRLLDYSGAPVPGIAGEYAPCTGTLSANAPSAVGDYGYMIEAIQAPSGATARSNIFTVTEQAGGGAHGLSMHVSALSPIASGAPFTITMTSSGATACTWSRSSSANILPGDFGASAIPVANGGPLQFDTNNVFSGWTGPSKVKWTFRCTNDSGDSASGSATLSIGTPQPHLTTDPINLLDFGNVEIGTTKTSSFTITNTGDVGSRLTGHVSTGDARFICTVGCDYSLLQGEAAHPVTVVFHSATVGSQSTPALFNGVEAFPTLVLAGRGDDAIATTPDTLNFGNVVVGANREMTIVIENKGSADLGHATFLGYAGVYTCVSIVTCGASGINLAPHVENRVTLRFTPVEAIDYPTQVGSLSGQSSYSVNILGSGAPPLFKIFEK